jgi:hypothetical protein
LPHNDNSISAQINLFFVAGDEKPFVTVRLFIARMGYQPALLTLTASSVLVIVMPHNTRRRKITGSLINEMQPINLMI